MSECKRLIPVPPKNIVSVILSEGEANILADLAREDDCGRMDCALNYGYALTCNSESTEWLLENVEEGRIHEL